PDGDQGYPGDLNAEVVYDWSDDCELEITYYAKTTAPTIINLTNHSYFNLKGEDRPGAMDQLLQINGSKYLRYDADCVCTGELVDVKGTPMD
ncbi:galactose-1-epimerase, partial [Xanthomonas citri pv. citri]|nr:galactose-1-epimerase [Xanthomonas citri pv. citri]